MTEKKKTAKKNEAEQELLPFNPLMGNMVVSTDEENEQKLELIEQTQSLAELNKEVLEVKQRQTELIVDNRKLDAAKKIIEGINLLSDKALDPVLISKMMSDDIKPLEYKMIIESIQKLSMTLKDVIRPSVADEYGNRKRTKIMAQFQTPSGEKISMGVAIDNDD